MILTKRAALVNCTNKWSSPTRSCLSILLLSYLNKVTTSVSRVDAISMFERNTREGVSWIFRRRERKATRNAFKRSCVSHGYVVHSVSPPSSRVGRPGARKVVKATAAFGTSTRLTRTQLRILYSRPLQNHYGLLPTRLTLFSPRFYADTAAAANSEICP